MADELRARTAQDFRERNKCNVSSYKASTKEWMENYMIPKLTKALDKVYAEPNVQIKKIELVDISDMMSWEVRAIEKWARSLGYRTKRKSSNLLLIIPNKFYCLMYKLKNLVISGKSKM